MNSRIRRVTGFLKERGLLWTGLYVLRTGLWRAARAVDRPIMRLEMKRVITGEATVTGEYHTVADNRRWNDADWSQGGEEWTEAVRAQRGQDPQEWKATLIRELMDPYCPRGGVGLEIGPGAGRWSEPLAERCGRLILADLNERCLELCRERFKHSPKVEYYQVLADGTSFLREQDFAGQSVDFVWSYDVFVHINMRDFDEYLREFARLLAPGRYGVIHHAGTYARGKREATRSFVDGPVVARLVDKHGLELVSQSGELTHMPGDLITLFRKPAVRVENTLRGRGY